MTYTLGLALETSFMSFTNHDHSGPLVHAGITERAAESIKRKDARNAALASQHAPRIMEPNRRAKLSPSLSHHWRQTP